VLPDSKTYTTAHCYSSSATTEISSGSSGTIWLPTSTRTTAPLRSARAGFWWATPWRLRRKRGIGMKHSDVFAACTIMSPCCCRPSRGPANTDLEKAVEAAKTPADLASLPFFSRAQLARHGMVARSEEPAVLFPNLDERTACLNRICSRNGRRIRRWRSSTIHRQPAGSIAAIADRCGRPGWLEADTGNCTKRSITTGSQMP